MPLASATPRSSFVQSDSDTSVLWRDAAARAITLVGTPSYVVRVRPILEALAALDMPGPVETVSWLSFKTHPVPQLAHWWSKQGRGVEVVSEAEFVTVRSLGIPVDQILVNGIAKHAWLSRYPVEGLRVHFDSLQEIELLLPLALQCRWRVGVRVHAPDERDARDASFGGPFGLTEAEAIVSLRRLLEAGADLQSIHFHLGQRAHVPHAYLRAMEHLGAVCEAAAFRPRFIDCGGGLPTRRADTALADLRAAVRLAAEIFRPELQQVWLENGRFLTEASTLLAVRVIDIKERPESRYLICDGGRTNQALAADQGPHSILLLPERGACSRLTTICGPTCMTDDILGRVPLPEDVRVGDVLLWMNAGAYHLPWETRFSHGWCAVALCDEFEAVTLARDREPATGWGRAWEL